MSLTIRPAGGGDLVAGKVDLDAWPAEVDLIISALEAGSSLSGAAATGERRVRSRKSHRVTAHLRLFRDGQGAMPWVLYTRDVTPRGIGFVTRNRLPLGYGGTVALTAPDGSEFGAGCIILRCRETAGGWFEGALTFNRPQPIFGEPENGDASEGSD